MNRYISLLLCTALGACASPASEESAPPPVAVETHPTVPETAPADEVVAALPEVRYYVISDA